MVTQFSTNTSFMVNASLSYRRFPASVDQFQPVLRYSRISNMRNRGTQEISHSIRCSEKPIETVRTCKNCKTQFDPSLNNPGACRYHTAHFGGETKRKFESVHSGGTMNTPESGKISQYWHCCGSEDPFDPGCTAAPHFSYDD